MSAVVTKGKYGSICTTCLSSNFSTFRIGFRFGLRLLLIKNKISAYFFVLCAHYRLNGHILSRLSAMLFRRKPATCYFSEF